MCLSTYFISKLIVNALNSKQAQIITKPSKDFQTNVLQKRVDYQMGYLSKYLYYPLDLKELPVNAKWHVIFG